MERGGCNHGSCGTWYSGLGMYLVVLTYLPVKGILILVSTFCRRVLRGAGVVILEAAVCEDEV